MRILPLVLVFMVGCGDAQPSEPELREVGVPVSVYPESVSLGDAPGLDNRHSYEITGPDWDAEHVYVADHVWTATGRILDDGVLQPSFDEPAPYTSRTPLSLSAPIVWRGSGEAPLTMPVELTAALRSTTDPERTVDFGRWELEVELIEMEAAGDETVAWYAPAALLSDPLPARVDVWTLELTWVLGDERPVVSRHTVPTSWRDPIPDAPLYKQSILWSSTWGAGDWPHEGEAADEVEHLIALSQLHGSRTLETNGYSYGAFPRPPRDQIDDRVNVFLDFRRSACGEFRGLLMSLIEYQGIDAHWIWFRFPEASRNRYSFYKTRMISAVGRETKHWYDTNHIIVGVGDRVYDPTYTVSKQSWGEYEDWMFEKYCLGQAQACRGTNSWCHRAPADEEKTCIDNPPGWQDDWHLEVIIADNYK